MQDYDQLVIERIITTEFRGQNMLSITWSKVKGTEVVDFNTYDILIPRYNNLGLKQIIGYSHGAEDVLDDKKLIKALFDIILDQMEVVD